MRQLTSTEIEKLASKPNVKRIAVENFLMTITANPDPNSAYMNLEMDARLYSWNPETISAILEGIALSNLG